jgi:hypothetical protein
VVIFSVFTLGACLRVVSLVIILQEIHKRMAGLKFDVLMTVGVESNVFWDVSLCGRFGLTFRFHLQSRCNPSKKRS